jgi:hypothetical protein
MLGQLSTADRDGESQGRRARNQRRAGNAALRALDGQRYLRLLSFARRVLALAEGEAPQGAQQVFIERSTSP